MPKKEVPIGLLSDYLPEGTYEAVHSYLRQFGVHLTITRERKSILGDYRHPVYGKNHRISINGNLNKWSFLITLLHELAHLLTFEQHGNKVMAHGSEWKQIYGQLLAQFLRQHQFPPDIEKELLLSLKNPAATTCAEDGLLRVLRRYDDKDSSTRLVEEIIDGGLFQTHDGRIFRKLEKSRKRFKCVEVETERIYLFSPVYEVSIVES